MSEIDRETAEQRRGVPQLYADYDVLDKRSTPSWNDATRRVVDARLALRDAGRAPRFLDAHAFATLDALAARIVPQSDLRTPVPVAALVDEKLYRNRGDGFRDAQLPPLRDAWCIGLAALDAEAVQAYARPFAELDGAARDALLRAMQRGELTHPAWHEMSPKAFFVARLLRDVCSAYYAHPSAWSEIGFGGPASPRGYVRMDFNRRDPWEAPAVSAASTARARHVR